MLETALVAVGIVFMAIVAAGMCYMAYDINHSEFKMSVIKSILFVPVFYLLMILESLEDGEDDITYKATGR